MDAVQPTWLGRYPIVHPDHANALETDAAVNEFAHKMPRGVAEKTAHDTYMRDQLAQVAAHHAIGMHVGYSSKNLDAAKKHSALYGEAMKALGHQAGDMPPEEVVHHMSSPRFDSLYKFKPHMGDSLVQPKEEVK